RFGIVKPRIVVTKSSDICCGVCHYICGELAARHTFQKWAEPGRADSARVRISGEDAIMRMNGRKPIVEPAPPRSLLTVLAALSTLDEEFPSIQDMPVSPVYL